MSETKSETSNETAGEPQVGGANKLVFPARHAEIFYTDAGTPYLKRPGVVLIGQTVSDLAGVDDFLAGFEDAECGFEDYLRDPTILPGAEQLLKFAGQLCYFSLGENRTRNAEADRYFTNIKASRHGSVLEHASFSFLIYGTPRSLTHELVRHRAGTAYSQVSQRYVDSTTLRFVERPEYQDDPELHDRFRAYIDRAAEEYRERTDLLYDRQAQGAPILTGSVRRELRKKVQQAARSCLPNETEAPTVVTLNCRALRHLVEMRADSAADIEIRAMAGIMLDLARQCAPLIFADYQVKDSPDGVSVVETPYRKV